MKYIFLSKLCNEDAYAHNGEEVEIIEDDGMFSKIRFKCGMEAEVYSQEVKEVKELSNKKLEQLLEKATALKWKYAIYLDDCWNYYVDLQKQSPAGEICYVY